MEPETRTQEALIRLADLAELREIESRIPAIVRKYGLSDPHAALIREKWEAQHVCDSLSDRRDELLSALWPDAYEDEAPPRKPHVRLDVEEVIDFLHNCAPAGASIRQVAGTFAVSEATARRKLDGAVGRGCARVQDGIYIYKQKEE